MKLRAFEDFLVRSRHVLGWAVALIALAVYMATLAPGLYPGDPATLLVAHLDLHPFPPLTNPLSGALIRLVDLIPGPLSLTLNLLGALMGAVSVWLVYDMVRRIPRNRSEEEREARCRKEAVQVFSALIAAFLVAFSASMWVVSTRFHAQTLAVFWLLCTLRILFAYQKKRRTGWLCLFGFMFGLGMTESAGFVALSPVIGVYILYLLWRDRKLFSVWSLAIAVSFLVTTSIFFLVAYRQYQSPAFEWRAFTGYGHILKIMFRDMYNVLAHSLPRIGWVLIALTTMIPFVLVVLTPKRIAQGTRGARSGSRLLHGCMAALVLAAILNTRISPWVLTETRLLLVLPGILAAVTAGYLAGYAYVLLFREHRPPMSSLGRASLGLARGGLMILIPFTLVYTSVANFSYGNARDVRGIDAFCEDVLEAMEDRTWLVSDGTYDSLLQIKAREIGKPLHIITTTLDRKPTYRKYLATHFENARLRMLAHVGIQPLLTEWLQDPEAAKDLAVMSEPDLWVGFGYVPVPELPLYVGVSSLDDLDAAAYTDRQRDRWQDALAMLNYVKKPGPVIKPWAMDLRRHYSRLANNQGVLLEESGAVEPALAMYRIALDIEPVNLSALLNQWILSVKEDRENIEELRAAVDRGVEAQPNEFNLWFLGNRYGYVRDSAMLANRGYAWAMSGKPDVALQEIRKALSMNPDQRTLVHAMAEILFGADRLDESRTIQEELLAQDPDNPTLLANLGRLAMRNGDFDRARGHVNRLEETGAPPRLVAMQQGLLALFEGRPADAKNWMVDLTLNHKDWLEPWMYLAITDLQLGSDQKEILDSIYHITESKHASVEQLYNVGLMLENLGQIQAATDTFQRILLQAPGHVKTYKELVRLSIRLSRYQDAEKYAEALLILDSRNAFGNNVMGDLYRIDGQYQLAEAAYQACISVEPMFSAYINLAWLAQQRDDSNAARKWIEQVLDINDQVSPAWHTLGLIELQSGDLDAAEKALNRALELNPQSAYAKLYRAMLYEQQGLVAEALALLDPLLLQAASLPSEVYEEVSQLATRLRRQSN